VLKGAQKTSATNSKAEKLSSAPALQQQSTQFYFGKACLNKNLVATWDYLSFVPKQRKQAYQWSLIRGNTQYWH